MRSHVNRLITVSALCCAAFAQAPQPQTDALTASTAGGFEAAGRVSVRRFDATGATLRLLDADGPAKTQPAPESLTLRLLDWRRGGQQTVVAEHAATAKGGDAVQYEHDGVLERYQLTPRGFEQSFVIAKPLTGHGDLVLSIAADAQGLRAPAVAAAVQDLQFRGANGAGIRYGMAVAFARGGERLPISTRYDGQGRIELIVPGALLEGATYPVIVDPVVGPIFNPGGAPSWDFEPDAAHAPLAGRYMTVWKRDFAGTGYIRAQIFEEDGTPATGLIVVTTFGDCVTPCVVQTVVGGAECFCIVFARNNGISARLYDTNGNALTPVQFVSSPPSGEVHRRPSASGMDDSGVIIAWDKAPLGSSDPLQIETRLLSFAGGTITGGVVYVLDTLAYGFVRNVRLPKSHAVVTISGSEWAVVRAVWERHPPTSTSSPLEVWTTCYALKGPFGLQKQTLDSTDRVTGTSAGGDNEELPAIGMVASTGENPMDERFLIAWQGGPGDIRGQLYNFDGPVTASMDIATTGDYETEPAVLGGACEFSVGYRTIGANQSVQVRAYRPDGTELTTAATTLRSGPDQYLAINGASRQLRRDGAQPTNRVLFVWQDGGGASPGIWDVQARFYEPVSGSVTPFGSGCVGPTGTTPQIATIGEPRPGNLTFGMSLTNAPPNSLAVLLASDQLTSTSIPGAPGCVLYAGLPILLALPTVANGTGSGTVTVPIPCSVPPGVSLAFQWGVYTPGHNAFGWIVSSDIDVFWSL